MNIFAKLFGRTKTENFNACKNEETMDGKEFVKRIQNKTDTDFTREESDILSQHNIVWKKY